MLRKVGARSGAGQVKSQVVPYWELIMRRK